MSWYKIPLSHAAYRAAGPALQEAFLEAFIRWAAPQGTVLFGASDEDIFDFYLSPGAVEIALPVIVANGGVPCEARRAAVRGRLPGWQARRQRRAVRPFQARDIPGAPGRRLCSGLSSTD